MNTATKIIRLFQSPRTLGALLTWPNFSFTSYFMVDALRRQRVLPETVLDVGANVGQFTVAAGKLWPDAQVHSFEAHPACLVKLRKNVSKMRHVHIYPTAVGEREDHVPFHLNRHTHSSSILPLAAAHQKAFPRAIEVEVITVPLTRLDTALAHLSLAAPVLLKIDVQGYEALVIKGAVETLKRVDYLLLETSFKPLYEGELCFTEVLALLKEYQFKVLRPVDTLSDPRTGEILQMDMLFQRASESYST